MQSNPISSFDFPTLIMDPESLSTQEERTVAWISTIALGILSLGIVQAGCAIYRAIYSPNVQNRTHQMIRSLFLRLVLRQEPPEPSISLHPLAHTLGQPSPEGTKCGIGNLQVPVRAFRKLDASAEKPSVFVYKDQVFKMWLFDRRRTYDRHSVIHGFTIRKEAGETNAEATKCLTLIFDEAWHVKAVHVDGLLWPNEICLPAEWIDVVNEASVSAVANISSYRPPTADRTSAQISVLQRNVKDAPDFHLKRVAELLEILHVGPSRLLGKKLQALTDKTGSLTTIVDLYQCIGMLRELKDVLDILLQICRIDDAELLVNRKEVIERTLEKFTTQYDALLASSNKSEVEQAFEAAKREFDSCADDLSVILGVSPEIETVAYPRLFIRFLQSNLVEAHAVDAGGLTKAYFDQLCRGTIQGKTIHFLPMSYTASTKTDVVPVTSTPCLTTILPNLLPQERDQYEQLGKLFMYCCDAQPDESIAPTRPAPTMGHFFDDSIFSAILALSHNEIDTPFENLPLETYISMAEAILTAENYASSGSMNIHLRTLIPICRIHLSEGRAPEQREKLKILVERHFELMREFDGIDNLKTLFAAITNDPSQFVKDHRAALQEAYETCLSSLWDIFKETSIEANPSRCGGIGSMLAPIHAIAKGMLSFMPLSPSVSPSAQWDRFRFGPALRLSPHDHRPPHLVISQKIQGSLDRKQIADGISAREEGAQIKAQWLRDWIQDPRACSEADVRNFLRWVTGSSGMPREIIVHSEPALKHPTPRAHTCFALLDVNPDRTTSPDAPDDSTREGFLHFVKLAINDDPDFSET
jgi:hypothetical protein